MVYPKTHFPGTPWTIRLALRSALKATGAGTKWRVPLEAIARYESDCNPLERGYGIGLMQLSAGMYEWARKQGFIKAINYDSAKQAFVVAIHYIKGDLTGYGGYGGIDRLVARPDRGPGEVLRYWVEHPNATYGQMRQFYNGY